MHFLIDAQLPPALARWIEDHGYSARHVFDLGLATASDAAIWSHAAASETVIVTKDEDFARRRGMTLHCMAACREHQPHLFADLDWAAISTDRRHAQAG
ncbi:MAG: DUF5615 family PIN-like protein [Gammaproteobacteria bacterium]